jgi:hypothetical protein
MVKARAGRIISITSVVGSSGNRIGELLGRKAGIAS